MNWRGITEVLMFGTIIALVLLCVHYCNRPAEVVTETEVKYDTIYKTDTITYIQPSPIRYIHSHDTIIVVDSIKVDVPVVQAVYKDSTYEAHISGGYFARLDSIAIFQQYSYITEHTTNTIRLKPKISVQVGIGAGWDVARGNISPIVGVTIGIPVWNYYGKK